MCFETFLDLFSQTYPEDLHIILIQLDNGAFHNFLNLNLLENVILLFQPAYSPEVNPIERLWEYIKEQLQWQTFDDLQDLRDAVQKTLDNLTNKVIVFLQDGNSFWKLYL